MKRFTITGLAVTGLAAIISIIIFAIFHYTPASYFNPVRHDSDDIQIQSVFIPDFVAIDGKRDPVPRIVPSAISRCFRTELFEGDDKPRKGTEYRYIHNRLGPQDEDALFRWVSFTYDLGDGVHLTVDCSSDFDVPDMKKKSWKDVTGILESDDSIIRGFLRTVGLCRMSRGKGIGKVSYLDVSLFD